MIKKTPEPCIWRYTAQQKYQPHKKITGEFEANSLEERNKQTKKIESRGFAIVVLILDTKHRSRFINLTEAEIIVDQVVMADKVRRGKITPIETLRQQAKIQKA